MMKAILRWYWSRRITGDEEFGYSATQNGCSIWASDRETLLDVLCGRVRPQ